MIRPVHVRMARAGLGWKLEDLGRRSGVNLNTISRFEAGKDILSGSLHQMELALRDAGVVILEGEEGPGIRLSGGEPQLHRPSKRGSRKRARKTVTPREE